MGRKRKISAGKACLWAVITAGMVLPAKAASIPVFNTGVVSQTPVALAGDGAVDSHYTLIASADPSAPGPNAYVAGPDGVFPIPPWLPSGPDSKWISPWVSAATNALAGTYTYRTSFDLVGLDPSTAVLTGRWAADNSGVVFLNGAPLAVRTGTFDAWSPFTMSSGFVAGLNTLDFVVSNAPGRSGNPTGLRVEIGGVADLAVPEPPTSLLIALALFGIGSYSGVRKQGRKL